MQAVIPTIHIAFADDHSMVRQGIISLLLSLGGIAIDIEAGNGQQLLDQLQQSTVLPQICIIDIRMPNMDGFTAVDEIRKRWQEMKLLILTASEDELDIIRMIAAGVNGYLIKSSDVEIIKEALISISQDGFYYSTSAGSTLFRLIETKKVKIPRFSADELEVLKYCPSALSYSDIAKKLNKTFRSIEGARDRLCKKLKINSRVELALFAVQMGLKPIEPNSPGNNILYKQKIK